MFDGVDLETSFWESALRLLIAAVCGGIIGWDRESLGRDAGLRTHILVAIGSAGLTLVAIELYAAISACTTGSANFPSLRSLPRWRSPRSQFCAPWNAV